MSSAPETDRDLTVTVKRVPGGLVSNWFLDNLPEGDVRRGHQAGRRVLPAGDRSARCSAFCGGSGITPVMSIAKHVLATTRRPVRLLYANRDRDSVIFDAALSRIVRPSTPAGWGCAATSTPTPGS